MEDEGKRELGLIRKAIGMAGIRNLQLPNSYLIYADKMIYPCIKRNNTFLLPLVLNTTPHSLEMGLTVIRTG